MATTADTPNPNRYLENSVHDLLSLKGRTIVITGGARGLGLAFALAVAEVGGNVAVLDAADKPHDHFYEIQRRHCEVSLRFYKYVLPSATEDYFTASSPRKQTPANHAVRCRTDVTNYDLLKKSFDQVVKDFGRIDGL